MVMIMMLGKGKGEGKKEHTPGRSWVKGILDADKLDKLNKELADAVIRADPKKVEEALKNGANPNTKESGRPLLGWAATMSNLELDRDKIAKYVRIVEILLNAGANEYIGSLKRDDSFIKALQQQVTSLGYPKELLDDYLFTYPQEPPLIHWAIFMLSSNVVKILIERRKVNLDEIWQGYTPLMLAALHGDMEIVKMLVEAGANITLSNGYWTAEDLARQNGHIEVAEYLKNKAAEQLRG